MSGASRPGRRALLVLAVLTTTLVGATAPSSGAGTAAARPITIATLGDFEANGVDNRLWLDAVRARLDAANARGGLLDAFGQRHPVEIVACNTASDPDVTAACAQQAVDEDAVAVVGMSSVYGDRALSILADARISVLGVRINGATDASNSRSFPLAAGLDAELAAMPQLLAWRGARTIAVVITDFGTATDEILASLQSGRALANAAAGPVVRVAPGTTNLAAAVAAATAPGVDGIVGFLTGGRPGDLERALRAANYTGQYATKAQWGNAPAASDPDLSLDGTLVVGQFPPSSTALLGWTELRQDLAAYSPGVATFNEGAVNYWLSARIFENLVRSVDVARIKREMLHPQVYSRNVDTVGFLPRIPTTATSGAVPRVFNRSVTFSETRNGELRLLTPRFFDPFTGQFVD